MMSEQLTFQSLKLSLEKADASEKAHLILTYHVNLYRFINSEKFEHGQIHALLSQLDSQIDYYHDDTNKEVTNVVSQPVATAIGKNYVTLLTKSKLKLYDTTNRFVSIFSESSKKVSDSLRILSISILRLIYESFGREVSSFIPLVLSTTLKNLKKDKVNLLNQAELFNAVIRNGGSLDLTDSLASSYYKRLKVITNIDVLASLYGCYGFIASFKKIDSTIFKSTHLSPIEVALSQDVKIRTQAAKSVAEALNSLGFKNKDVIDIYIELYINSPDRKQHIGVIESIIHFASLKTAKNTEYVNENFNDLLILLLDIFKHERATKIADRLISNLHIIFKALLKLTGEPTQALIFDKNFQLLDLNPGVYQSVVLLQLNNEILTNLSTLSDHDLERYHITLWKLSTSTPFENIRIHAISVLKTFAKKFPSILKELLETSLNELINITKQPSSSKIFEKAQGFSLILANLISLSEKDYVPESMVKDIWIYASGIVKQKLELTEQNFNSLSTSWITIAGVFTYSDVLFVNSLTDDFISLWDNTSISEKDGHMALQVVHYSLTAVLSFLSNIDVNRSIATHFVETLTRKKLIYNTLKVKDGMKPILEAIESRISQIYLKLIDHIKSDNSSILINAINNFAGVSNHKSVNSKTQHLELSEEETAVQSGLTSKFLGFEIDELSIKYPKVLEFPTVKEFSLDLGAKPKGSIRLNMIKSSISPSTWIDELELSTISPISTSYLNDPFQLLLNERYSLNRQFAPSPATSTVDSSIEIFAKSFSSLTPKVQLSLLETLRSHFLSKSNDASKLNFLCINVSVVLNGALSVAQQQGHKFDDQVGSLLLETIRQLHTLNPTSSYLWNLNAQSIGILISKTLLTEQIPIFIKKIVDKEDSSSRAFNSLILSDVYQFDASHFTTILDVLLNLSKDPHPVVHSWALESLSVIINKHVAMNGVIATDVLTVLNETYLSDNYGKYSTGTPLGSETAIDSNLVIAKTLRAVINSLGPGIKDLADNIKAITKNLIYGLLYHSNSPAILAEVLKLIQNLSVFDKESFHLFEITQVLKFAISKNILGQHVGSGSSITLYEESNEVFPVTSSSKVLSVSLDFLLQLVKTHEDKAFLDDFEYLVWVSLEIFPTSPLLQKLVAEWLDITYDIDWFNKLQKLFNSSKLGVYAKIIEENQAILNKFTKKTINVDVQDEEAQSIANKEGDENKGEPVNWKFKVVILTLIKQLLRYTSRDSRLYYQLASRVSDLIKISYSSSTSSVIELRLLGIDLLGDIIKIYCSAKDPIYPKMALLEQQQAQITSALVPAFQVDSTPLLASEAIKVVATFIGSSIVSISRLNRITKILTDSLRDLQNDDELKINEVVVTSEIGQRRIKLAILNSWAELTILSKRKDHSDEELDSLVNDHLDTLLPLWVSTLKECALLKHGPQSTDSELFDEYWINLVDVIGCITHEDSPHVAELLGSDSLGFYYMLYAHCIYSLLGNNSTDDEKLRILKSLKKVLDFNQLVELTFHGEIYGESIEVFERLVITGTLEQKLILIDITSTIFLNYFDKVNDSAESLNENLDKLFEIVRVNLQPIIELIPLKSEDEKLKELSNVELQLLKRSFSTIIKMISRFPDMIKIDLYSSILVIVQYVYERFPILVPHLVPVVKEIMHQLTDIGDIQTINSFYQTIKRIPQKESLNKLLTFSVLVTTTRDYLRLSEDDIDHIVEEFTNGLADPDTSSIVTQAMKAIIGSEANDHKLILKSLVPNLILKSLEDEDPRLYLELVILAAKHYPSEAIFTILLTTLLQVYTLHESTIADYVHRRLLSLLALNPEHFKAVISGVFDTDQRALTEKLMKADSKNMEITEEGHIKLKTFA